MKETVMQGKPYAGNPHVRFDEGAGAPRHSGRSALLYKLLHHSYSTNGGLASLHGVIACAISWSVAFMAICAEAAAPAKGGVLERFYSENDGATLRRLPSWVMPQPSAMMLANEDLKDDPVTGAHARIFDLLRDRSDWNVITFALRCVPDLSSPVIEQRVADAVARLNGTGVEFKMNIDPRIMRNEFFSRWPDDCLHLRQFETVKPDAVGTACFRVEQEFLRDHKCYGTVPYSWWKPGRLVSVRAVKNGDPSTLRNVEAKDIVTTTNAVSGVVMGLAPDEVLLAEADFPLREIDPCSPHLLPFMREMMLRYKKLGVSGSYMDEWGFQSPRSAMVGGRAFWHSEHFARDYAAHSGGRDLERDLALFALGVKTEATYAAANAYIRTIFDRCREMEGFHYDVNKEMFGPDAFVGIHPTWHPNPGSAAEYFHDGLDWWVAKRDWALTDESTPVCIATGLAKKFGSPLWLNQGYSEEPVDYVRALWRYALCGGRMNWHGITAASPADSGKGAPYLKRRYQNAAERRYRRLADLHGRRTVRADETLRLLPLMTCAPVDCPVAHVFGHERLVNWQDPAYCDWGREFVHGLGAMGYYADAYPASEIAEGTFAVDEGGRLQVGDQRYAAVVLHNLSASERKRWDDFVAATGMRATRAFVNPSVDEVAAHLESVKAVKQTPFGNTGFRGGTRNLLPPSDGIVHLTDGTVARIKGGHPDLAGDVIEGEIEAGGIAVKYKARGLFAVRAENGALTGIAGGEISQIAAPGMSLALPKPADIALVKLSDGWHGVWQTGDCSAPVPAELLKVTRKWVKLRGWIESAKAKRSVPQKQTVELPAPTFDSVAYGSHPMQKLDAWLPRGVSSPAPVIVYIHGGGFRYGSRKGAVLAERIPKYMKEGIALVSVEYRLLKDAGDVTPPVKVCMDDIKTALVFVRSKAKAWNLDLSRMALTGGSAGACASLCMALADDNAFGIRVVLAQRPQTTLDPNVMREWIPNSRYGAALFGCKGFQMWLDRREELLPWIEKYSPSHHLAKCNPAKAPAIICDGRAAPPAGTVEKDPTHSGIFIEKFCELAARRGISCRRGTHDDFVSELVGILRGQSPVIRRGR